MKTFIKNNILIIAGVLTGAVSGFMYWNFIGCTTGHCAIQSIWYNSTGYGAIMGGLIAGLFKK